MKGKEIWKKSKSGIFKIKMLSFIRNMFLWRYFDFETWMILVLVEKKSPYDDQYEQYEINHRESPLNHTLKSEIMLNCLSRDFNSILSGLITMKLRSPLMMPKMVIMKDIVTESYQRDTLLIEKMVMLT